MSMKAEVIGAMWLYGQEYSQSRLSATDFYANLSPDRKRTVGEMVTQIGRAHANAALEKVAQMMEQSNCNYGPEHAAAIRALREEG